MPDQPNIFVSIKWFVIMCQEPPAFSEAVQLSAVAGGLLLFILSICSHHDYLQPINSTKITSMSRSSQYDNFPQNAFVMLKLFCLLPSTCFSIIIFFHLFSFWLIRSLSDTFNYRVLMEIIIAILLFMNLINW